MQSGSSFLITQLIGQAPMLIVYLTATVLALVLRRRSPLASSLVIAGALLQFSLGIANAFVIQSVLASNNVGQRLAQWSIASTVLHAVASALIVAAAFVDRGRDRASGFEVRTASLAPATALPLPPGGG